MKFAIALGALLLGAAPLLVTSPLAAQQAVTAPRTGNAVSPGFSHAFTAGLSRTSEGWVARDYPRVSGLVQGSAAARAGIRDGDVIVSVNGHDARRPPLFNTLKAGDTVVLRVRRGDEEREIRFAI